MDVIVTRTNPDELYHWGVKGMKWGVRKKRSTTTNTSSRKSSKKINVNKPQLTKREKTALKIAGGMAVIDTLASARNYKATNNLLGAMDMGLSLNKAQATKKIVIHTGAVAAASALAYIGGTKLVDTYKRNRAEELRGEKK